MAEENNNPVSLGDLGSATPDDIREALRGQPSPVQDDEPLGDKPVGTQLNLGQFNSNLVRNEDGTSTFINPYDSNLSYDLDQFETQRRRVSEGSTLSGILNGVEGLEENFMYTGMQDTARRSEEAQGVVNKMKNGMTQLVADTAINVAQGFASLLYGVPSAIVNGDLTKLYDNAVANGMDRGTEFLDEFYKIKRGGNQSGMQRAANFLFDDVAGAASFVMGAIATELAFTALTAATVGGAAPAQAAATAGLVARGTRLVNKAINGGKYLMAGRFVDDALRGAQQLAANATRANAAQALRTAGQAIARPQAMQAAARLSRQLITGASMESGMEARHMLNAAVEDHKRQYEDLYGQGTFTDEMGEQFRSEISGYADSVFGLNMALVGGSNMLMFPKLFGVGLRRGMRSAQFIDTSTLSAKARARLAKNLGVTEGALPKMIDAARGNVLGRVVGRGGVTARTIQKNLGKAFYEGFVEEGGQGAISRTAEDYISKRYDPRAVDQSARFVDSFLEGLKGSYMTGDGFKEIGIGALMAFTGVPMYVRANRVNKDGTVEFNEDGTPKRQWKLQMMGGYVDARAEVLAQDKKMQDIINLSEKYGDVGGILRAEVENMHRQNALQREQDIAIGENDFKRAKDIESDMMFSHAASKIVTGRYDQAIGEASQVLEEMTEDEMREQLGENAANMTDEEVRQHKAKVLESYKRRMALARKAYENATDVYRGSDRDITTGVAHMLYNIDELDAREKRIAEMMAESIEGYNMEQVLDLAKIQAEGDLTDAQLQDVLKRVNQLKDIEKQLKTKQERNIISNIDPEKAAARQAEIAELQEKQAEGLQYLQDLWDTVALSNNADRTKYAFNLEFLEDLAKLHSVISTQNRDVINRQEDIQRQFENLVDVAADRLNMIDMYNDFISPGGVERFENRLRDTIERLADMTPEERVQARQEEAAQQDLEAAEAANLTEDESGVPQTPGAEAAPTGFSDSSVGAEAAPTYSQDGTPSEQAPPDDYGFPPDESGPTYAEQFDVPANVTNPEGSGTTQQAPTQTPSETTPPPTQPAGPETAENTPSRPGAEQAPSSFSDPGVAETAPYVPEDAGMLEPEPTYDPNNVDSEGKGLPGEPDVAPTIPTGVQGTPVDEVDNSTNYEAPANVPPSQPGPTTVYGEINFAPLINARYGRRMVRSQHEAFVRKVMEEGMPAGTRLKAKILDRSKGMYDIMTEDNVLIDRVVDPNNKAILNGIEKNGYIPLVVAEDVQFHHTGGEKVRSYVNGKVRQEMPVEYTKVSEVLPNGIKDVVGAGVATKQMLVPVGGMRNIDAYVPVDPRFAGNTYIATRDARDGTIAYHSVQLADMGMKRAEQLFKTITVANKYFMAPNTLTVEERNLLNAFAKAGNIDLNANPQEVMQKVVGRLQRSIPQGPLKKQTQAVFDALDRGIQPRPKFNITLDKRNNTIKVIAITGRATDGTPVMIHSHTATGAPRGTAIVDLIAKMANQRMNLIQEDDVTVIPDGNGGFKAYRQAEIIEEFASFSDRMPYVRNGKVYNRLPNKLVYRSEVLTEVPTDNPASNKAQEAIIEGEKPAQERETLTDTFDFTDDTYNDAGFDSDYLPQEAPSTSEIDAKDPLARAGALYEVKGLTPREIRDGINFSAGVMAKAFMVHLRTVDRKSSVTARYLRDRVRNEMEGQLENLQAQRPSAVRDKMIEAYTHWLDPAHFTRLMDLSLVEMLRQSKGIIELRAGNLDKAIDKLGEEELSAAEEDEANDAERKENPMAAFDDNFAFGTDPKSTLRLEAKMLLMGLQHRVTPATINPNNFGLAGPRFIDQADLQNKINAACAGVNYSYEAVHQRLRDFSFTYPEFRTVLDALTDDSAVRQIPKAVKAQGEAQYEKIVKRTKNLQKQIRQQFTTFAIKEETTWESGNIVSFKAGNSETDPGTPSDIQIFNSNQRNMREFVKADIKGILIENKFFTSGGKLNKPKFKRVVAALDDIAKAAESDRKLMLSKVLQREFGISVDPAAFSSSNMTGNANGRPFFFGLEQELGNVNMHSNYYGLMRKALRDVAEKDVSLEDFIADSSETGIDPPGKHIVNFFVGLADYRTNFIQNSSKDGDNKLRWHYSMPKLLHQLLRDAVYGDQSGVLSKRLSGLRVSKAQGIDDRSLVKISYLSGIKLDGKGKERGFHDMELGDQALAQLAFYGNRGANRYDGGLLLAKFFMPTLADKHTMPIVQLPALSASRVKFNLDPRLMHLDPSKATIQHVIKNLPELYDLTMRKSVDIEVQRILRLHAADYEGMSAAQRKAWGFMMMPQLNYFAEELRANRIKRADFEKQVHLAATKHFIASVDNDFKEMLSQLEGTVYTYNTRRVTNRDNTVSDISEISVPKQFNIANKNFHWMGMHLDPAMEKTEYTKPGMSQAAFLAFIGKYVIDAHSARTGITMDVLGDPGAFAKTKKDGTINAGKSLATMSKRFASFIAPGTAIPYVDWSYVENKKMVTKSNRIVRSLMLPARIVSKAAHWDYLEKLGQTPDQLAMQEGYDSADGAEWTTAEEHLSILFAQGQISESDMVGILKKLQRNEKLDEAELGWFQAMKPVTTGRIGDHLIYVKSASFPLVPQLTAGTELDKLREFMEKNNIQRAAYDSAVKVGNEWTDQDDTSETEDRRMLSVHEDGKVVLPEGLENRVISYDRRFMRIQQPVPVSKTTQKVHGSQVSKLLFVDLADAVFSLNGQQYKGKELYKKYIYHRKAELDARMELFGLQYGMEKTPSGRWVHTAASRAKFAERIMEEAISRNYDANEIAALHYDYEKGDFSTPLIAGPSQDRIENLVKAVLFKEVYEPMTEGYSGPIRPEVGLGVVDEKILNDSNIVWVKRDGKRIFNGKLQVAQGSKPDQILMPWKYKAKLDKFLDKEGNINAEDLPPELLNTFAYRIPGQRKSSSASFEIVGFLPKEYGDTLIVNEELVGRIGQDYDIDKMFGLLYTVEQDKEGKISVIRDESEVVEGDVKSAIKAQKRKIAINRNAQLDIYIASMRSEDENVQRAVHAPVTDGYAEQLADQIAESETKMYLPMSMAYSNMKSEAARSAKRSIGVFASQNVFHSQLEQVLKATGKTIPYHSFGNFVVIQDTPSSKKYFKNATLGQSDIHDKTFLFKYSIGGKEYIPTAGKRSDQFSRLLNHAVDNENNGLLGKLAITQDTWPIWISMTHMGYNQETITMFSRMPIIQEYLQAKSKTRRLGSRDYVTVQNMVDLALSRLKPEVQKAIKDDGVYRGLQKLDVSELNKQDMYEVLMGTSTKSEDDLNIMQFQVIHAMSKLEALNGDIQKIQKLMRLDTNRPKSIAEMESNIMDIEQMYVDMANEKAIARTVQIEGALDAIARGTVGGMVTNNIFQTASNMFALQDDYNQYRETLRSTIRELNSAGHTYEIGEKANTFIKGLKSIAYAKFTEDTFGRSVEEMRAEMHNVNTGGIAKMLMEMREKKPEVANNPFFKQVIAVDKPGKYPHLEFTGDRALETNPLDMHRAFLSLLKSEDPEVKAFAEYVVAYALVTSNGRLKSRGFMKFIPAEWLESKGVGKYVNNSTISKLNEGIEHSNQVVRHNPDLAPKYYSNSKLFKEAAQFRKINGETVLLVSLDMPTFGGTLQVDGNLYTMVGTIQETEILMVMKYTTPLGDYLLDEYSPNPVPLTFQPREKRQFVQTGMRLDAPPPSMMDAPPANAYDEAPPYTDRGDGYTNIMPPNEATPTFTEPGMMEQEPDYVRQQGIPEEAPAYMGEDGVGVEMEPEYTSDAGYYEAEPTYDPDNVDSEGKGLPGEPVDAKAQSPVQDKVVNQIQREENTLIGVHSMDKFLMKFPQYSGVATAWMKKMLLVQRTRTGADATIKIEVVEGPTVPKFIRSENKIVISEDEIGDARVVMHELMHALTNTGFQIATMERPAGMTKGEYMSIKNAVQNIDNLLKSAVTPGALEKMGLNWADYQRTVRGYRGYIARRNGQTISEETASDIQFLMENRDKYYGFVNSREFVSELFSNKQFAEQLAKLETGTSQTWLEKFLSAIEEVLVALGMDKSFAKSGLAAEVYGHAMALSETAVGRESLFTRDPGESYLIEDFLVEAAMAPDVEGYTYKGIAELKAYKKKRIRQFQELRSRYKDNREYVRRVNARLAQEEKELERLNDDSVPISPEYVLSIGQRELDLARRTISNVNGTSRSVGMALSSLENVYSIIDFYDQAREIMSNPVLKDIATELRRDAAELRDDYLEKARQILRADAMGTFNGTGVDINSDTFDTLQQTGFMKSRFLDASRQGLTELSYLDKIVRDAAHKQRVEFNKRAKAYLDKSNAFKKTAYFKKYGWEGMIEKDKNGNPTSKIITMFSGAFEAERKVKYGQHGNRKEYYDWLDSVTERVDVNTAFDYSGDTVTRKNNPAYKNYLEGKFGVGGAQELMRQQETVLQEYIDARESAFDNIEMSEDRSTWDAKKAEWVAKHDPGSKYEQIRGRRQGVQGSTRRYLVDFPLREVNGRSTGYYDARFTELMQEKEAMEFYTEYRKQITELGRMLPSHKLNRHERLIQNGLFVPAMSKTLMSDLMTKDGLMQAVTKLPDHMKAALTIESKTDINQLIDPTTGRPRQELPVYFTGELDPETQEYDLDRTFLAFAMMSTAYDSKNAIEDKVRMTRSVLNNARVKAESGPTAKLLEKAGLKLEAGLKDAVALDSIMKSVDTVVDTFYGYQETRDYTTNAPDWMWTNEQKEKIEKLQEELIGAQSEEAQAKIQAQIDEAIPKLSAAKSGRMLQQMTQAKGMAWNIPGAIVNFIFGSASVMKHAAGRRDFSEKDSRKAFGIMTHSTLNQLTLNTGLTKTDTSRKIQNMMINLDVLKDYTEIRYDVRKFDKQQTESGINASVQQGIDKLRMYEIQRSSEYFVYGQGTIAHLLSVEVDGKSLWEHMDENGIIQLDGYRPGEEKHLELMSRIDQINKRIHGNYDPNSPIAIKKTVLGPLLMQFRSWLPEAIASRFEQEKYDPYLERTVKGTFQTMFFSGEIGKHFKAMLPMLLPSFIRSKGMDTLPDDISAVDQENIRKFGASLQQWIGILLTIAMLNALKDDEDDEESVRVLNFGLNIASRLKNDLTLFGDPRAMIDMTQGDMLAIVGYMVDVMAFGDAVVDTIGGDGEIATGVYAGKSKMLHHGGKLIPHLNSVQRIQNMMARELG